MTSSRKRRRQPTRIFSEGEKKGLLVGHVFRGAKLEGVDFSGADLRAARFEETSLRGCDFSSADLRGAQFIRCDVRGARFTRARFQHNWFEKSWFAGAIGLSKIHRIYIQERGGSFVRLLNGESPPENGIQEALRAAAKDDPT